MAKNRKAADRARLTARGKARQDAIHAFIVAYICEHSRTPTVRDIARGIGIASSTAEYHLEALAEAGRITRDPTISRGIGLPADTPEAQP